MKDLKFIRSEKFLLGILLFISFFIFFYNLGGPSLFETDEVIYNQVAREIVRTGDWLTMHLFGKVWFIHPPFYMWLTAASSFVFGINEFNIRLWNALFAIGLVFVTYLLGKKLYKSGVGLLGAFILATGMQFIMQAHMAIFDIPYIFFMFSGIYMLFHYMENKLARYYYIAGILFALSMLMKGPVGILLPAMVFTVFLMATKNLKALFNIHMLPVALLTTAIGGSWYFVEYLIHGKAFYDSVVAFYLVGRFTTTIEAHYGPIYFYVLIVLFGFLPWTPLLFFSVVNQIQNLSKKENLFSVLWMSIIFIFFSIAKTKLPGYIMSFYPIAALSIAEMLIVNMPLFSNVPKEISANKEKIWLRAWSVISVIGLLIKIVFLGKHSINGDFGIVLFIIGLSMVFYLMNRNNSVEEHISRSFKTLAVFGVFLVILGVLFRVIDAPDGLDHIFSDLNVMFFLMGAGMVVSSFLYFKDLIYVRAVVLLISVMVIFAWYTSAFTFMTLDEFKPMKAISQKINEVYTGAELIVGYDILYKGSILYYTDKPITWTDDPFTLRRLVNNSGDVIIIAKSTDFPDIGQEFKNPTSLLLQKGDLVLIYKKE